MEAPNDVKTVKVTYCWDIVKINATRQKNGVWLAYMEGCARGVEGKNSFDAIRNYLDWLEVLFKNEEDDLIADLMGMNRRWMTPLREDIESV